jgi:hypothetical protein
MLTMLAFGAIVLAQSSGVQGPAEPSCHASNYNGPRCVHLSPAEARVLTTVAKASSPVNKQILMYTKYEGVLLLYYAPAPTPCQNNAPVCTSYGVLGSPNLAYSPYVNVNGPLPRAHLAAVIAGEDDFSCIGHITREAYKREHVEPPWQNANFDRGVPFRKCYW